MNKRKRLLALLINGVLLSSLCMVASAVDTTTGEGNGVAYGTGSKAPEVKNVAIGNGAEVSYANGTNRPATGDIAIGSGAHTNNYVNQGGGIAIGEKAFSENMGGTQEEKFNFKQTTFTGTAKFFGLVIGSPFIPADSTKMATGIAIGQNTYARSGSTMIGTHNYKGDIADTSVDTSKESDMRSYNIGVNATTIGVNSFNNSTFGVVNGAYSAMTSGYAGGDNVLMAPQNFGATITGSLNSIESKTATSGYAGIANSIVGVANRTNNSNGSLVFGAGNEITNSITSISGAPTSGGNSAKELAEKLRTAVKDANSGGATMAFGGGNKADYTLRTSMIGVNNTITGVSSNTSNENLAIGVGNTGTKVQHMTVIGSKNTVSDATNTLVFGDNRSVKGANHTVILGSSDNGTTTTVNDAVAIGHNTEVSAEGGVALGSKSKATVAAGAVGYDISTNAASTATSSTWKATASAVSVGDVANDVTRQITSVAAGTNDTDAVNVAQLKLVQNQITASTSVTTVTAGNHIKVTPTVNGNTHDYKVSLADDIANQINNNTSNIANNTTNIANNTTNIANNTTNIANNTTNINKNTADIKNIKGDISKLDKRVNRGVAGAAALAALHPLDFDPDAKWDFAAGYGHYHNGNAAALGAFYRPNEDVQLSVGSTVGNGETVVNAGLSVKVGAHSNVSRSRVAIGKEVLELKKTVALQNAQIQKLTALLNGVAGTNMKTDRTTLFPDVPTNHWAYEAVSDLSRRGLVEGYPDGTFGGDHMMTRYEFAQIVYRAMQNGAQVDEQLVTEFGPEMALFRVDTVAKDNQGQPTIERVRVNKK